MKDVKYTRFCPKCSNQISYSNQVAFYKAVKNQQACMSCSKTKDIPLTRTCPQCMETINYRNKGNRQSAEKYKKICRKCSLKNRDFAGSNNPFYGKKHTDAVKKKISKFNSEERVLSDSWLREAKQRISKVCNTKPLYEIWLEKYGVEEADARMAKCKLKHSMNSKGEKNNMFGKPAPQGSGNGWSGWYNEWYFRSLRELSYMINVIEKYGYVWKTPGNTLKIPYVDHLGQLRTYFPDFVINNEKVIEIKPKKLHSSPKNIAKRKAAEKFCQTRNMTYEIIDPDVLSKKEIHELYVAGKIRFLPKYEEKFRNYLQL